MWKKALLMFMMTATLIAVIGCMNASDEKGETWTPREDIPEIPAKLVKPDSTGIPTLTVYDVDDKSLSEIDIETYVMGVVAGEMKNDWPMEALKAQAILARTFVMKFCADKQSKYKGADISTDVTEAQAYAPEDVNERVRQAVNETRGQVLASGGSYAYAWFHAHSGGMTERPSVSLDFDGEDPDYLVPVQSSESPRAPEDVKHWEAAFTLDEVAHACADAGVKVGTVETVEIGERGESGRARTLIVNGEPVSCASFRVQIGANKLKSTLIEDIRVGDGKVIFEGRGFGHGVGMSQWGAYAMAEKGDSAEEIIRHYFSGVDIVRLWR